MKDTRDLIQQGSEHLNHLVQHAKVIQKLNRQLQQLLPVSAAGHVSVANIDANTLIILADSPTWATQTRYRSKNLLQDLKPYLPDPPPHSVQVITRPVDKQVEAAQPARSHLPHSAAQSLRETAEHIQTPALKKALQKLAENEDKD